MIIPDKVKQLARAGKDKKIEAIYYLRRATGLGLAEAKEIIETIAAGGEVQLASPTPASPNDETREQRLQRQIESISRAGRTGGLNNERIGKKLLEILRVDEELIGLTQGMHNENSGILVASQIRLLFMYEKKSFGPNIDRLLNSFGIVPQWGNVRMVPVTTIDWESPLDNIYLIHHRPGMDKSSIKVFMQGYKRAEFTGMENDDAKSLAKNLMGRVDFRLNEFGKLGLWDWDDFEQAEAMYDHGIITGPELARYKRRVLDQVQGQHNRHTEGKSRPS